MLEPAIRQLNFDYRVKECIVGFTKHNVQRDLLS